MCKQHKGKGGEKRVFTPTFHMFGQALDLSDNGNLKETANRVLKVAGQKYDDGNFHVKYKK